MGGGSWTTSAYTSYMSETKGVSDVRTIKVDTVRQFYDSHEIDPALDPKGVEFRECCDSEEHPNTVPVILALDVTGSMGSACAAVARQLDEIITNLYKDVEDVEIMVMGIGDFAYDRAPLQVSQFESDVRICDQLGKIWFERGGGGNSFESYTAAWYFAFRHTKLDCWKRGRKGIIITMGDEPLNPYLPGRDFERIFGYGSQDIETKYLYEQVIEKFDVYHIIITDPECSGRWHLSNDKKTWGEYLDEQHLFDRTSDKLPDIIHDIVVSHVNDYTGSVACQAGEGIAW